MSGYYYSHTTYPVYGSQSSSILEKSELDKIQTGFDKFQAPTGYGTYLLKYNTAETGVAASNVSVTDAGVMTVPAGFVVTTGTVTLPSTTSIGPVSSTEIGYLDGVTSALQTQMNLKAPLASPPLTGTPTAPTAAVGTSSTQIATTAFAAALGMSAALPAQLGNSGLSILTDGTTASWGVSAVTGGGTGQSSYAIGDLLYASGATALSKLAAGSLGLVLKSGGPGVAPNWGTAGIAGGGTGIAVYTVGDTLYASGTTTLSKLAAGAVGTALSGNGTGTAPSWKIPSNPASSIYIALNFGGF